MVVSEGSQDSRKVLVNHVGGVAEAAIIAGQHGNHPHL